MSNMNDEKLLKKENTVIIRTKAKLKTEVFEVEQKIRVSNCIRILDERKFCEISTSK